jgi:hypothetical protein
VAGANIFSDETTMGKVCERAVTSALSSNGKQQLAYPSAVALLLEPWLFFNLFFWSFSKK